MDKLKDSAADGKVVHKWVGPIDLLK